MIGNPKYDDNRRRAKELMSFSHIFRIGTTKNGAGDRSDPGTLVTWEK